MNETSEELREAFIEKAKSFTNVGGLWGMALTRKVTYLPVSSLEKTDEGLLIRVRVSSRGIDPPNSTTPELNLQLIDSRIINGGTSLQESSYTWVAPDDLASSASITWDIWAGLVGDEIPDVETFNL